MPVLNPADPDETWFYYAGGDGPHTGQRDDSIGLARATTHAYAGLRPTSDGTRRLVTEPIIDTERLTAQSKLGSLQMGSLSVLADIGHGAAVRVGLEGHALVELQALPSTSAESRPTWHSVPTALLLDPDQTNAMLPGRRARLVLEATGPVVLYALRNSALAAD